jgi:hypothetical protein
MKRFSVMALFLTSVAAQAAPAHQDWVVRHQPDRFVDRVMMEAWADADKGPARMSLYCDTENGFRVMFMPHRNLMPEGSAQLVLTIDDAKPLILAGDAFGDDTTDVVTVHDSDRIQGALSRARHVAVKFQYGSKQVGEDAFTFGDLSAERPTLMKVCRAR